MEFIIFKVHFQKCISLRITFSESMGCNIWNATCFLYVEKTVKPVALFQPVMEEEE